MKSGHSKNQTSPLGILKRDQRTANVNRRFVQERQLHCPVLPVTRVRDPGSEGELAAAGLFR
jgi:hypothetical protein